ncbi:MAG TPA: sugar transferase [Bryobacteraceae bacterium]|nr:sugar transferase [Bryobacteraceae bacterium]
MKGSRRNRAWQWAERPVDAVGAAAGLILMLPLLIVISLGVLADDGPPVLFGQTRVGKNGKPFRIWKFRTMRAGSGGSAITASGDPRVTRFGAVLRKFKLDELPQLFNVLKGEMSLVGPRPETPEYVEFRRPVWQAVLAVRPGITDLATLLYRDEERILASAAEPEALYRERVLPEKLRLNLAYLGARTLWQDLRLIFLTIRYSVFPDSFDINRIRRTFGIGLEYERQLYPISSALDRRGGDSGGLGGSAVGLADHGTANRPFRARIRGLCGGATRYRGQ